MTKKASPVMQDIWLLILRVVAAGSMLTHGIPKLLNVINGQFRFPDPLGIGSVSSLLLATGAEFFCSVLVLLGIYTRWTSMPIAFSMFVAVFFAHSDDVFAKKELAVVYMLLFITLSVFGGGNYAVGKLMGNKE
ncbi:MAG: DoxX family protein [Mangrovibacterium sp.]